MNGVKPWELDEQPAFWTQCALTLAEGRAQAQRKVTATAARQAKLPAGAEIVDDIAQLKALGVVKD